MSIYTNFVKTAKQLIQRYGRPVQWAVASDDEDAAPNIQTVYGVFKTASTGTPWMRFVQGLDTTVGNVDLIIAQQSFTPTMFDTITDADRTYTIKSLNPIQPGAEVIVWKIELNK